MNHEQELLISGYDSVICNTKYKILETRKARRAKSTVSGSTFKPTWMGRIMKCYSANSVCWWYSQKRVSGALSTVVFQGHSISAAEQSTEELGEVGYILKGVAINEYTLSQSRHWFHCIEQLSLSQRSMTTTAQKIERRLKEIISITTIQIKLKKHTICLWLQIWGVFTSCHSIPFRQQYIFKNVDEVETFTFINNVQYEKDWIAPNHAKFGWIQLGLNKIGFHWNSKKTKL